MKYNGLAKVEFMLYSDPQSDIPDPSTYFKIDIKEGWPTEFQVQNLAGAKTAKYGGDAIAYYLSNGNGAVSGSLNALSIPYEHLNALLGYQVVNGIAFHGKATQPPYVAVKVTSHTGVPATQEAWIGLPKVQFASGDIAPTTDAAEPTEVNDQLTYTATNLSNGHIYMTAYEGSTPAVTAEDFETALFGAPVPLTTTTTTTQA